MDNRDGPFKTLSVESQPSSPNSGMCPASIASQRAEILFGSYRKGDANDPDTYCASITAVLATFSEPVVRFVTDPRTGLASTLKWLPSVAEVKEACVSRQAYLDKLRDHDRRWANRAPAILLRPEKQPGYRANVFIPEDNQRYQHYVSLTDGAAPYDYAYGINQDGRSGLRVALSLIENQQIRRKTFNAPIQPDKVSTGPGAGDANQDDAAIHDSVPGSAEGEIGDFGKLSR